MEFANVNNIRKIAFSGSAYDYLGVHNEGSSFVFRVWAPHAEEVFVIGGFNDWSDSMPMKKIGSDGIWELRVDRYAVRLGDIYKYKIRVGDVVSYKADPYGFYMECRPGYASIVTDIEGYKWKDASWLERRRSVYVDSIFRQPINVYEVHLGTWKRRADGGTYSYLEIARELAPYVKQMGFTHVELMPVTEYPNDESWGYQVGGYFAPTSRYGNPKEFMEFIDILHGAGVGVILDWVPAHFPEDDFGLADFDGMPLYEYPNEECRTGWGTRFFNLSSEGVKSFLISSADFWIKKYHIDGLRVDAVGAMLANDDSSESDETRSIRKENAKQFLQEFNSYIKSNYPDVMTIAEDSSAQKHITGFENDGLGFDLKWNMGWTYDVFQYANKDFWERKFHHGKLNFLLSYAFDEQFILPVSHDDVTEEKLSLLGKMPGDEWRKFAGARLIYAFGMTHPGKKLSFMGNEIAEKSAWRYDRSVEWALTDNDMNAKFQFYVSEINDLYLRSPELWQEDGSWSGFEWIDADDSERSILSFRRIASNKNELLVVLNFTPEAYEDFILKVPKATIYKEIFNSDDTLYGGSGVTNKNAYFNSTREDNENILHMRLPPLGVSILKIVGSNSN